MKTKPRRLDKPEREYLSDKWRCCRSPGPFVIYTFAPTMWFDPDWNVVECLHCRATLTTGDYYNIFHDPEIPGGRAYWESQHPGRYGKVQP